MYPALSLFPSSANWPGRGVREMRSKPSFKVGRVMVSRTGDKEWLLRYRDPQTQRDVRRCFRNTTEAEIQDMAATIPHEALSMKGYLPGKIKHAPPIKDGLAEAMRLSRMGAVSRKNAAGGGGPGDSPAERDHGASAPLELRHYGGPLGLSRGLAAFLHGTRA